MTTLKLALFNLISGSPISKIIQDGVLDSLGPFDGGKVHKENSYVVIIGRETRKIPDNTWVLGVLTKLTFARFIDVDLEMARNLAIAVKTTMVILTQAFCTAWSRTALVYICVIREH